MEIAVCACNFLIYLSRAPTFRRAAPAAMASSEIGVKLKSLVTEFVDESNRENETLRVELEKAKEQNEINEMERSAFKTELKDQKIVNTKLTDISEERKQDTIALKSALEKVIEANESSSNEKVKQENRLVEAQEVNEKLKDRIFVLENLLKKAKLTEEMRKVDKNLLGLDILLDDEKREMEGNMVVEKNKITSYKSSTKSSTKRQKGEILKNVKPQKALKFIPKSSANNTKLPSKLIEVEKELVTGTNENIVRKVNLTEQRTLAEKDGLTQKIKDKLEMIVRSGQEDINLPSKSDSSNEFQIKQEPTTSETNSIKIKAKPAKSLKNPKKRKRVHKDENQINALKSYFSHTPRPNQVQRQILASQIGLPEKNVKIWFYSHRVKSSPILTKKEKGKFKRIYKDNNQIETMKNYFSHTPRPNKKQRQDLALQTGLTGKNIYEWFCNNRTKQKKSIKVAGKFQNGHEKKLEAMETYFSHTPCPNEQQRKKLSIQIGLPEKSVKLWFHKCRVKTARSKTYSTEAESLLTE